MTEVPKQHPLDRRHCPEICIPFHDVKKDIETIRENASRLEQALSNNYAAVQIELTKHEAHDSENFRLVFAKLDKVLWTTITVSGVIIMFLLGVIMKMLEGK